MSYEKLYNIGKNNILNFGKYKGKPIEYVAKIDMQYINWANARVNFFHISKKNLNKLKRINKKNKIKINTKIIIKIIKL